MPALAAGSKKRSRHGCLSVSQSSSSISARTAHIFVQQEFTRSASVWILARLLSLPCDVCRHMYHHSKSPTHARHGQRGRNINMSRALTYANMHHHYKSSTRTSWSKRNEPKHIQKIRYTENKVNVSRELDSESQNNTCRHNSSATFSLSGVSS